MEQLIQPMRNMRKITSSTDVQFDVYGFDSDIGMPKLEGCKDHPEIWHEGQFKSDHNDIRSKLPSNAKLISGNIAHTIDDFFSNNLSHHAPVGFASIDVDLYTSTVSTFNLFKHTPCNYLPQPFCILTTSLICLQIINGAEKCSRFRSLTKAKNLGKLNK